MCLFYQKWCLFNYKIIYTSPIIFMIYTFSFVFMISSRSLLSQTSHLTNVSVHFNWSWFNNSFKHTIGTQNKQVHVSYTVFPWFGFSFHYLLSYDKIKMQNAYIRICNNKICIVVSLHFWFRIALRWISPLAKCRRFLLHAFVTMKTRHSIQQW